MKKIGLKETEWICEENGSVFLRMNGRNILRGSSYARHADGREVDTQKAVFAGYVDKGSGESGGDGRTTNADSGKDAVCCIKYLADNGLVLTQQLGITAEGLPWVRCILSQEDGTETEASCLSPLVFTGPAQEDRPDIWKSLWTKMLLVPYDNTMWQRYEAVPFRPGRESSDLTVLMNEESLEGLLIGAADFDTWKNGIVCSTRDANVLEARSGVAGALTHDSERHGSVIGKEVASSRFFVLYGEDYRKLLESYGELIAAQKSRQEWNKGVPFGWNSWAGLAFLLDGPHYRSAGRFMKEVLVPGGFQNEGTAYVNLDAGWSEIPEEAIRAQVKRLHEAGLKAGIYDAPFAFFDKDAAREIPGAPGHCFTEILLKGENGSPIPRVDGAIPMDVTHPVWKRQMKWKLDRFLEWGFDYVKLDFLSHGGMEGVHYDRNKRTGRQAIEEGYSLIKEQLSEERAGRPFFISLSIAPLFPHGFGHARRFSCDAFGMAEDVEYVLNAQTYAWWQSGRLYAFNDPDHISLFRSFNAVRDSLEGEARARYTAAAIAGTVMMLSDDYGIEAPQKEETAGLDRTGDGKEHSGDRKEQAGDREKRNEDRGRQARDRAKRFACNKRINELAAAGVAFRPVGPAGTSACHAFTAHVNGKAYLALFHWNKEREAVSVACESAGLPMNLRLNELWSGWEGTSENGYVTWTADGCDAVVYECSATPNERQV